MNCCHTGGNNGRYKKCTKDASYKNAINVGNHKLYYCDKHFAQISSDMIRPGGPNSTHRLRDWKTQPQPLHATPNPQPKKWNQPSPKDRHKIENRRTQWEKEFIKLSKKIKKRRQEACK